MSWLCHLLFQVLRSLELICLFPCCFPHKRGVKEHFGVKGYIKQILQVRERESEKKYDLGLKTS